MPDNPLLSAEDEARISTFRQGDILETNGFFWLADPARPLTRASRQQSARSPEMVVTDLLAARTMIVTQSCDLQETSEVRPFVSLCPVVERRKDGNLAGGTRPREVRVTWMPPTQAGLEWVALPHLAVTWERSILLKFTPVASTNEDERRRLAFDLGRYLSRAAVPDEINIWLGPLRERLRDQHEKNSPRGRTLKAIEQVRFTPTPDYDMPAPRQLTLYFIVDSAWLPDTDEPRPNYSPNHGDPHQLLAHMAESGEEPLVSCYSLWREVARRLCANLSPNEHVAGHDISIRSSLTPREFQSSDVLDVDDLSYRAPRATPSSSRSHPAAEKAESGACALPRPRLRDADKSDSRHLQLTTSAPTPTHRTQDADKARR